MPNKLKLLRSLAALEGVVVALLVGAGAQSVWPDSGLFAFGVALYLPLIIDKVRGS